MKAHAKIGIVVSTFAVLLFWAAVADADQATLEQRTAMSQELANSIHDREEVVSQLGVRGIEVGAAVVDFHTALADWRSTDGKHRGQVAFFYACDHWNPAIITSGKPISAAL